MNSMIATLLRPKTLSFRNRWRKQSLAKRRGQDIVLLIFSLVVMGGMYQGSYWALKQMNAVPFLVYMPPSLPLGLMLVMLLAMVCVSSLASALGNYFLAEDIDLLMACPIPTFRFFAARFCYVLLTVAWMPFVFIFPVLLAFGNAHAAPWHFYIYAVLVLLPYFVIPASCAVILASLVMSIIDPRWTRFIVVICVGFGIATLVYVADILTSVLSSRTDPNQVLRLVATLSAANTAWMPSAWAATALSEVLVSTGKDPTLRVLLLYATAVTTLSLAFLSIELLHARGYTRARNGSRAVKLQPDIVRPRRRWITPRYALVTKEFRSIFRDLAQSTQILFLGCMCLLYLANLRIFISIDSFPPEARLWWQNMFFIMHTSITAFFTSSICTRVVFSSVSLEGKHFWLLQIAPLNLTEVLRSKFWAWYVPVSLISAVLFSAGAYVIIGRVDFVLFFVGLSFFVSYGIVGLGIGLGALFADFSWEHPSQLALSLGSFIYMLTSASLVILNIIPISILLRLETPVTDTILIKNIIMIALLVIVVASANIAIAQLAMRSGEKSLAAGAST